jgi:hypothetical protein
VQISLTVGTVFHKTRTPLVKWSLLVYCIAVEKVGVPIAQRLRALVIRDYRTAWLLPHEVRQSMTDRDATVPRTNPEAIADCI